MSTLTPRVKAMNENDLHDALWKIKNGAERSQKLSTGISASARQLQELIADFDNPDTDDPSTFVIGGMITAIDEMAEDLAEIAAAPAGYFGIKADV